MNSNNANNRGGRQTPPRISRAPRSNPSKPREPSVSAMPQRTPAPRQINASRPAQPPHQMPKSAPVVRNTAKSGNYGSRRPNKNSKGSDTFLWILIIFIVIAIAAAVLFLFVYLKDFDNAGKGNETTGNAVITTAPPGATQTEDPAATTAPSTTVPVTTSPVTTAPVTTVPPATKPQEPEYKPTFTADLSAYEQYMNPTGDQRDAYIVLVNYANPLSSTYIPSDLTNVSSTRVDGRNMQKLRLYAAKALEALMLEAEACGMRTKDTPSGFPLSVTSAYRSYEYQNQLFNQYVNEKMVELGITRAEAEKIVEKDTARAGTSEHQSGLCVDMHTLWSAEEVFKNEKEAKWLAENCYKFGFILRFPEGKMDITKITYEPWHFRYVGRYHAYQIHQLGMCLEEYTEYLKTNS